MYNQVIFYNAFGAGDIFESREFVKAWMKLVPAHKYCYAHGKNPRILLDIPEIEFKEWTIHMDSMRGVWDDLNGNLYVNTWIGRDGKYVLPGIGCTVEKLIEMHGHMLNKVNLQTLSSDPLLYIPSINYEYYNIVPCKNFLYDSQEYRVFIDNGLVQSRQAENFDMNPCIIEVAKNHSKIDFIVTHAFNDAPDNVYFTSDITQQSGFDLNEVSFLSTFCNTLIGRNSGPHVFAQVRENVMNKNKKLISFTYHQKGSSFVVNTNVPISKYWSPATEKGEVIRVIERIMNE